MPPLPRQDDAFEGLASDFKGQPPVELTIWQQLKEIVYIAVPTALAPNLKSLCSRVEGLGVRVSVSVL